MRKHTYTQRYIHTRLAAWTTWIQFAFPQSALYLYLISCVEVERLNNGRTHVADGRRHPRSKRSTNNNNLFRCFSCTLPSDRVNSSRFLGLVSSVHLRLNESYIVKKDVIRKSEARFLKFSCFSAINVTPREISFVLYKTALRFQFCTRLFWLCVFFQRSIWCT